MKGELDPKRIILLCLPILVGFCFLMAGIEFLKAETPDDTLAGIVMLVLGGWTLIFLIFMLGYILRTVAIDEEGVSLRKRLLQVKRYAFADIQDAFCERNALGVMTLRVLLKNGAVFFAIGLKNSWALANKLRKRLPVSTTSKPVDTLKSDYLKSRKMRTAVTIVLLILIGLAVVCLGVAVVTTGEKDLVDFNAQDWQYFSLFMSLGAGFFVAIAPVLAWVLCLGGETESRAWAWKRGVLLADPIALTMVNGVYVDGGFTTRVVCGKVVDDGVELVAVSVEEYKVKGNEVQKSATIFYDEMTKDFWIQRIYSGDFYPMMATKIEEDDIFIL